MKVGVKISWLLIGVLVCSVSLSDGLDDILKRGTVRVGVTEFIPWTFRNKAGQLEGSEIDAGNRIAADMGVGVEFKSYTPDALFDALKNGEVDFVAAGLAITPSRALRAEFSTPYFESGAALITNRKLAPGVREPNDLNKPGFVIAVADNTLSAGLATELFDASRIQKFPDSVAAEKALLNGKAHAFLTSLPDARIIVRRHGDVAEMPLPEPIVGTVAGFAVKRGNQAVLNYLNAWVAARHADHWLDTSYAYWFNSYDWIVHARD